MRGSSSELLLDASGQSHRTTTTTGTLTGTTTIHNLYSGVNHHSQSSGGIYDKQEQSELRRRKLLELGFTASRRQPPRRTCRQRFNFYATSALALVATSGGAALLFLVPLYVDPAISTLAADFSPHPVLCTTLRREEILGIFNCTWSSCREGCTSDVYRCTHIYVTYSPELNFTNASLWTDDIYDGLPEVEAVLKVNIKGCGYPPVVDCDNFTRELGYEGARFPCHYSRVNGSIVMANYNREAQLEIIIHFFAAPFVVTLATSVALCVMHCDCRCVAPSPRHARGMRKIRINNLSDQSISNRVDRRAHHAHCDCGEVTRPL